MPKKAKTKTPAPSKASKGANAVRTPAAPANGRLVELAYDSIVSTDDNPRTIFDAAKIAGLAEAIAHRGLLQPLEVCPHPQDLQRYILVDGERRWRAIGLLRGSGIWPADRPIPCTVTEHEGDEAMVDSLVANAQRVDLTPLEQGAAYKRLQDLDPDKWSTGALAAFLGVDRRYVQQRLALVDHLAPDAQAALTEGKLDFALAREIATVPPSLQIRLTEAVTSKKIETGGKLREAIERERVPVSAAIFDLAPHAANIVKDAKGKEWFADAELFDQLQMAAAREKAKALKKEGYGWVEVKKGYYAEWEYQDAPKGADKAATGAIINVKPHSWERKVTIRKGLVRRRDQQAAKSGKSGAAAKSEKALAAERKSKERLAAAQQKAAEQLQPAIVAAVAKDADAALRVLAFSLVSGFCGHGMVRLEFSGPRGECFDKEPLGQAGAWRKTFAAWLDAVGERGHNETPEDRGRLWSAIMEISERELPRFLAAVVASGVTAHSRGGGFGAPVKKIDPALVGLAALAGIPLPEPLAALLPKAKGNGKAPAADTTMAQAFKEAKPKKGKRSKASDDPASAASNPADGPSAADAPGTDAAKSVPGTDALDPEAELPASKTNEEGRAQQRGRLLEGATP